MNSPTRIRGIALHIPKLLLGYRTPSVSPSLARIRSLASVAIHTSTKEADVTEPANLIRELLRGHGSWDCLNSRCKSMEITDAVVGKVLVDLRDPADAKKALLFFHWSARHRGHRHGARSYCLMVHILVRAGFLVDARALLESAIKMASDAGSSEFTIVEMLVGTYQLVLPGPGVFDLLVISLSKMRMFKVALEAVHYLSDRGVSLSLPGYNALLKSAERSGGFDAAWKVFELMVARRRYPNQATVEIMIDALRKGGALQEVVRVLDRIRGKRCPPSVVVGTALALRMIEDGRTDRVMVSLTRMLQRNMIFDDVACSLSLYAYCRVGDVEMAYSAFDEMLRRGLKMNSFVYTSLIVVNCMEGRIEEAYRLMDEMVCTGLDPYDVTFNELIICSCKIDSLEKSVGLFDDTLRRGLLPSVPACNAMVRKLCDDGQTKKADELLTALIDKGFVPDEAIYSKLIDGYGRIGSYQEVLKLYYEMQGKGPPPDLVTYTALVKSLCQCGRAKEAEKFAKIMKHKLLASSEQVDALLVKCK